MPRSTRTFVAITVPEDRAAKLEKLQAQLAPEVEKVRWVSSGHFHATLAFLGDVPDTELNEVCRAVAEASVGFPAFELRLEALGAFPRPDRPRNLWVGLAGPGVQTLADLHRSIGRALARIGYPPAEDRFNPHVTLGRVKADRSHAPNVSPLVERFKGWSAGSLTITEVVTFASSTTPEGPIYTPLSRAPLNGGKHETTA